MSNSISWNEVFNLVCEDMEKTGELPTPLDYWLANKDSRCISLNTDNIYVPMAHLDYGGNEGIYLSLYVPEGNHNIKIGTFKTLDDSEEDIEQMAQLYGRFINALYRWVLHYSDK